MNLSPQAVDSYWDELEKIASKIPPQFRAKKPKAAWRSGAVRVSMKKAAGVLPEFLAKTRRDGFIDPRSDDFSKNQAFGRAAGMSLAPASVTAINLAMGKKKWAALSALATAGVGGGTYASRLRKYRKLQKQGKNPVTGAEHDSEKIERTRKWAKKRKKQMSKKAARSVTDLPDSLSSADRNRYMKDIGPVGRRKLMAINAIIGGTAGEVAGRKLAKTKGLGVPAAFATLMGSNLLHGHMAKKAAATDYEKKRKRRRAAKAIAGGAAGYASGYAGARFAYPAILKALGKQPGPLSPRARHILGITSGLAGAAMLAHGKEWVNVRPRKSARKLRPGRAVQPKDGKLAERHEGHSPKVPSGSVLPSPSGGGVLPLRARKRAREHSGDRKRIDHYRSGGGQYRYGGEAPRDHNFAGPVRVR